MSSGEDPRTDPAAEPELERGVEPGDGVAEPGADVESDPAYAPDDEELRRLKGA